MNKKAYKRIWQNVEFEVCAYIKLLARPHEGEIRVIWWNKHKPIQEINTRVDNSCRIRSNCEGAFGSQISYSFVWSDICCVVPPKLKNIT